MASKRRDGSATNRDFERYDQVAKPQTYHLSEQEGLESFDDEYRIRTCDMNALRDGNAKARDEFAQDLGTALHEIGFAILVNHEIDTSIYDEVYDRSLELFTKHSLEDKMRYRAERHGSVNQGYFPILETSNIHPDLVEGWVFCRRAFGIPQRDGAMPTGDIARFWPNAAMEPSFRRLVQAHESLILPLMQSILTYLDHDPHTYDARLTRTNIGLRLNYYPPLNDNETDTPTGRLLGHEDVGMFTILPAPRIEGLQALNRRNMKWVRLSPPPGSIIFNTGDYVQRITNDILPSTTHRVSKPRSAETRTEPRLSFPMNVYIWEDEMIEVLPGLANPKYKPISALEFHTSSTSKFYGDDYAVKE